MNDARSGAGSCHGQRATTSSASDGPGVVVLPPVLFGLALLAVVALHWAWPAPVGRRPAALAGGAAVAGAGLGLAAWGRRTLVRGGTASSPRATPTALVTNGPFTYSRNPMYIGVTSVFLGLSLVIGTWWGFAVAIPVLVILHVGVIRREERYLEKKFGADYGEYRTAVRRYV